MSKNVYVISDSGGVINFSDKEYYEYMPEDMRKMFEDIGNKFNTKKEAELAVKKLKALKRLMDKDFGFVSFCYESLDPTTAIVSIRAKMDNDGIHEDLELLFGKNAY